jgi:hypothetical protein
VSEEDEIPYRLLPLSKTSLKGQVEDLLPIKAAAFYDSNKLSA